MAYELRNRPLAPLGGFVLWVVALAGVAPVWAQRSGTYDAVPGRPFGVARLTIQTEPGAAETIKHSEFRVEDAQRRVFYAVCRQGTVGCQAERMSSTPSPLTSDLTKPFNGQPSSSAECCR